MRFGVRYKKEINSSIENLWKLISSPGHLNLVHPFCKKNYPIVWEENNHKDVLIYLNGLKYEREFTNWEKYSGYSLLIGNSVNKKSKVDWTIETKNNLTFLTITVYPYLYENLPKLFYKLIFYIIINPMLKKYLKSVLCGIEWHILNDKPVKKNMFGKHLWFSKFWFYKLLYRFQTFNIFQK